MKCMVSRDGKRRRQGSARPGLQNRCRITAWPAAFDRRMPVGTRIESEKCPASVRFACHTNTRPAYNPHNHRP
jgi:hypothetical protein